MLRIILFFCFLGLFQGYSQSAPKKIDSLMKVAESSNDSIKLRLYNQISFYYIFNEPDRAKKLLLKGIKQSQNKKIPFSEAELINTYGIYYDVSGKPDSAKYYFEKALDISQGHQFKTITVMVINNLGMFHWNNGNYQEALDYFFQALEMNKNNTVRKADATYLNNIGLIYQEMGQIDKALEYHTKSLKIRRKNGQKEDIAVSLNNIGINLTHLKNYEEAEKTFKEAIKVAEEANEMGVYYNSFGGLANIYILTERYQEAIPILENTIAKRTALNIERRANLSTISNLIIAYARTGNLQRAKENIQKGNEFLNEFSDLRISAIDFYRAASETYFMDSNISEGSNYFEKALVAKDSLFSTENAEKTADLETKFKLSEKEKDLAQSRANLAETKLEVEQKNIFILGIIALAILLGVLGYFLYSQQKLKNRQLQKEGELETALAKIETQNKLQEQRLRISRDLHDNIGAQLTFIISSIDNLKFGFTDISEKLGNKLTSISNFTSQTIYELRDTIWAMNKENITFEDLQARIANFIEHAKNASERTDFSFNIDYNVDQTHVFSSVEGMNIYRIIQEAVNNSLKYASADEIEVNISEKENLYHIEIADNGIGFNQDTIEPGNGLNNMKKRAREIGGNIEFVSKKNKGTKVLLIFPLNQDFHN